ncbi:MAG: dienelactone hydrolase family protein [Rhodospirillaceae bacterium]
MDTLDLELRQVLPKAELGRRGFAVSALATGFALAVRPAGAQTITTDTKGIVANEEKIKVADGMIPGYCAYPEGQGPFPTVLVVQEIFGVHEHIKDICRRLAKAGYFAVAPELYARQGDVSKLRSIDEIRPIVSKVPDAQVMSDLDATAAWAANTGAADTKRLGITGFCWGGRIVWLYAAHNPNLGAGVAWYGRLTGDVNPLQPKNPIDVVSELQAPVLGLYASNDAGIPLEAVNKMKVALKQAGKRRESVILVYPETEHGFHADYRPTYNEQAAVDGWNRLITHFRKNGVA